MLFAITCLDKPDSLPLRQATRTAHLEYLGGYHVVLGGPLLDPAGAAYGSLLVVDIPDRAAAEAFAASDPYARVGLFDSVTIQGFRAVIKDGFAA